jgi:argininosuccinate lyase
MQSSGSEKLWGGRFSADMADLALAYSESIDADAPMVQEDIWGSQAHALMLARCGIIPEADLREILRWLEHARLEYEAGRMTLQREREDVHMNVEFYLREQAGPEMGGRLHTARSRNDQVVTDCRMHLRSRLLDVQEAVAALQSVLLSLAAPHTETVMPGYTHTQHAQPISVGFWLSGHAAAFARDQQRLEQTYARVNRCPLGAAALAGTSFPTDRRLTAALLGFDHVEEHALDCVGDRDFVMESLADLAILGVHLARLAEEIVVFSTYEFGMLEVHDRHASGSSIMPQKKNPCLAELARGKTGRIVGRLMQSLMTFKGLISGYNRDLQEDKPPLWEALNTAEAGARVLAETMRDATLRTERMRELVGRSFATATELANYLVRERGLPFRTCHEIIGALVGALIKEGKTLDDHARVQELLAAAGQELSREEIAGVVDPEACLRLQRSLGSTGPEETAQLVAHLQEARAEAEALAAQRRAALQEARRHTAQLVEAVLEGRALAELEW